MRSFSKLGIILTSVLSFLLLALLAEILYLLWRRRQLLRLRRTRIEPTSSTHRIAPSASSDTLKLEGLTSRVLFTINEEDREELDAEELSSVGGEKKTVFVSLEEHFAGELPEVVVTLESSDVEAEPPFLTPCASPPYYTPTSSPGRERK